MTREEILSKAKSILFNTEMVRSILAGRKTVTRRPVKPQPPKEANGIYERMDNGNFQMKVAPYESIYDYEIIPPYQVGDYLYVRETWTAYSRTYGTMPTLIYKADGNAPNGIKWRPSIHMPKEAARIFLRVTGVRVERLQDITEEQAIAEGCNGIFSGTGETIGSGWSKIPQDEFSEIWDSTVKKSDLDKYGWDVNPWVWVIEFERVEVE